MLCADQTYDGLRSSVSEENLPFPVLLKPTDSSGARGMNACYNEEELKKYYLKVEIGQEYCSKEIKLVIITNNVLLALKLKLCVLGMS